MIGRTLSHYRILERLGAGGMGEVYRARDEKLGRDVAVKVLPAGLLGQQPARERFKKEALALSRLSHPHIATLLDFDHADGEDFLVMELVAGKPLVEALRGGPLAEKEVVRLGTQFARGLQAAHEHGVVHRDLKPANLALTPDGLLKILDFGLARLEHLAQPAVGDETASTDTAAGRAAGTPAYMAPEQLLGKPADARTDVYGAGACLYEMATGRRPFGTKSGVGLTDAVLHELPTSPRTMNCWLSLGLDSVVVKCLDKDPGLRYQSARELLVDLDRLQAAWTSGSASQAVAVVKPRRRRWLSAAAAAAVLAALAAGAWLVRQPAPPRLVDVRALTGGLDASTMTPLSGSRSWTTDGSRLYFVGMKGGRAALLQVPITGGEPVEIPVPFTSRKRVFGYSARDSAVLMGGAEPAEESIAVSPDGWPLWMVPAAGGAPRRLGSLRAIEAALSPDGERIAFTQSRRVLVSRTDGADARPLLEHAAAYAASGLRWSPDGRMLRYTTTAPVAQSVDDRWVWEIAAGGGQARPLWPGVCGGWSSDGRFFFLHRWNASGRRFDVWAVRERSWLPWPRPQPVRLTQGPLDFSAVGTGSAGRTIHAWGLSRRGEMQRIDPASGRLAPYLGGLSAADLAVSADGRWLAWVAYPAGTLWRARADGSDRQQLTTPPLAANLPRFSPDGQRIVFVGAMPGETGNSIWIFPAAGGEIELVASPGRVSSWWDTCWLPDGRSLVSSSFSTREPGLHRIDSRTLAIEPMPGAEGLLWPKCRWQGGVLAVEPASAASGGRMAAWVFWPEQQKRGPALHFIGYPNWTRDGKAIIGANDPAQRIERYSLESRRTETLVDTSGILRTGLSIGPWMGLGPDDAPLVLRSHDTWELYALDWEAP